MISLVDLLISLTARCGAAYTPKHRVVADRGPTKGYVSVLLHEPDSFMGQQQQRRQQSREAKVAETHAAAVAMLLLLLLPLLPLLLPLTSLGAAIGRCYDDRGALLRSAAYRCSKSKSMVRNFERRYGTAVWYVVAVALLLLLLTLLPLLLPLLLMVSLVLLMRHSLSKMATPANKHVERVFTLLVEQGAIGLGEVEESRVSLITSLRYAVLCIAQLAAYCFASAMLMCADLCKSGDDGEIPEGATKYLVVEFNAWVYSGVRTASVPPWYTHTRARTHAHARTHTHMHTHAHTCTYYICRTFCMRLCRSPTCCGRRLSKSSTIKWRSTSARRQCANTERASLSRVSCPPTRPIPSGKSGSAQCADGASTPRSPQRAAS